MNLMKRNWLRTQSRLKFATIRRLTPIQVNFNDVAVRRKTAFQYLSYLSHGSSVVKGISPPHVSYRQFVPQGNHHSTSLANEDDAERETMPQEFSTLPVWATLLIKEDRKAWKIHAMLTIVLFILPDVGDTSDNALWQYPK